jgi:hypothetical protein
LDSDVPATFSRGRIYGASLYKVAESGYRSSYRSEQSGSEDRERLSEASEAMFRVCALKPMALETSISGATGCAATAVETIADSTY